VIAVPDTNFAALGVDKVRVADIMDVPKVVGSDHHSDKIATTNTTNSPLTYIVKAPHYISGPNPDHHYSKPGYITVIHPVKWIQVLGFA